MIISYETVVVNPDKPGSYTVMVFDKVGNCVGSAENILAWTRSGAYSSVADELAKHCTWNAWRTMNLAME